MSREDIDLELYDVLNQNTDETGLPVMNKEMFLETTEKYGKETFRATLANFITKEKPPFPLNKWDFKKIRTKFHDFQKHDYSKYIMPVEKNKDVLEKYDDYEYDFKNWGLRVIDGSSTFNYTSDSFMHELRMDCSSYGFKSPLSRWNEGDNIWGVFGPIWRGVNDTQEITRKTYIMAFRLGTYIATQFKPTVAKTIYELSNAKTVLDTSMGWGDRLTAFYASSATHYIGCDPNPNTFEKYKEMQKVYDELTRGTKTIDIYRCGAENLWDEYYKRHGKKLDNIDCAFTSPPYFSTERYNEGGENEEDQSWAKFNEYEKWRDEFYLPVSKNSFDSLNENGVLMVNILDPKIKGTRYRSGDELVNSLRDNFIGQIGMRISQRPQGASVFHKEVDGVKVHDKEAMDEFMKKIYIENVWCFSKNKDIDLFSKTERGTLESFLT